MRAKGTAIRVTPKFVKINFPDRYDEWFDALPDKSKEIFSQPILGNQWYPVQEAIIEPTRILGEMFYGLPEKGAFEVGKFSALDSLKGIYKAFVRVASINFIIKRAPTIFSTYYDRGKMEVIKNKNNFALIRLSEIEEKNEIVLYRIAGWIAAVPVVIGKKEGKVEFSKKVDGPFIDVLFTVNWEDE